jgi:hypothetical protein
MLNPSTADATEDDPTIRKCIGFSQRLGFGGFDVVNLFALRSRHPRALQLAADPIGPENDAQLRQAGGLSNQPILVAWGAHGAYYPIRVDAVMGLLHRAVRCLALTKDGQPGHPLMLSYKCQPQPWEVTGAAPGAREWTK